MRDSNLGAFINILTDFGFKFIFGNGADPIYLISLLNAVFDGEPRIEKIIKIDKEQPGENIQDRTIIYDVHCLTDKGETIIVEMQNRFQEYYRDRAIYYISKDIISQGEKGQEWKFSLKPVYGVFLMNFDWKEFKHDLIRDEVCLISKTSGKVFSD